MSIQSEEDRVRRIARAQGYRLYKPRKRPWGFPAYLLLNDRNLPVAETFEEEEEGLAELRAWLS